MVQDFCEIKKGENCHIMTTRWDRFEELFEQCTENWNFLWQWNMRTLKKSFAHPGV